MTLHLGILEGVVGPKPSPWSSVTVVIYIADLTVCSESNHIVHVPSTFDIHSLCFSVVFLLFLTPSVSTPITRVRQPSRS